MAREDGIELARKASSRLGLLSAPPAFQEPGKLIGVTPLVRLRRVVDQDLAPVYVKMENMNPSGSIRDRYVAEVLNRAIDAGQMQSGDEVALGKLDDSALSAGLIGGLHGLKVHVFAPKGSSKRLLELTVRHGVKVHWTDAEAGEQGSKEAAIAWTREGADRFFIEGVRRQAVRDAYRGIAEEIVTALAGEPLGAFVTSVSTGGTYTEVAPYLRDTYPSLVVAGAVLLKADMSTLVTSEDDVLKRMNLEDVWAMRDEVAREEGLLLGPKGAACVLLARDLQHTLSPQQQIVTLNPDAGQRYLGWEEAELFG